MISMPTKIAVADPDPAGVRIVLDLPPEDYFATIRAATPRMTNVRVGTTGSIETGDSCWPDRPPIELSADVPVILATRWSRAACTRWPWCPGLAWNLRPAADGRLVVSGFVDEVPRNLNSCNSACPGAPDADCISLPFAAGAVRIPVSAGSNLHLAADHSPNDAFFAMLLRLVDGP